jgi:hypothetical protein
VYTVQVPGDATPGTYTLTEGTLEYYIGANGSYVEDVAVDNEVEAVGISPGPVGGTAYPPNKLLMLVPWIALGAAIIAGTILLVRRRRSAMK